MTIANIQPPVPDFPKHMPDLSAVVIAGDLSFPVTAKFSQRIVKLEEVRYAFLRAGVYQLLPELLGGGDLRGQRDQLVGGLSPQLGQVIVVVPIQPFLQNIRLFYHGRFLSVFI